VVTPDDWALSMANEGKARLPVSLYAGAGVGALIGLIVGLSTSAVTSTILGSLSTALLALLGLSVARNSGATYDQSLTVAAFGFSCTILLITGVYLRTHNILAPSIDAQDQQLHRIFPDIADRQRILLYEDYGLFAQSPNSPQQPSSLSNSLPTGTNAGGGYLRNGVADKCDYSRRKLYANLPAYLAFLHGTDQKLAAIIESQPSQSQDELSFSISNYLCP
jgi:hypothetical protein